MCAIARPRNVKIDRPLIDKYTIRGPRYTSYPTAPEWTEQVGDAEYRKHLEQTNVSGNQRPISIYIHVPFCTERCYYCACNVIISPQSEIGDRYVDTLMQEIDLVSAYVNSNRRVTQFHFGGGTPTFLQPDMLRRLLDHMVKRFKYYPDAERSIEVDVRVTNEDHLNVLREFGFNRISFGVQDFSRETQEAIRRVQSPMATQNFTNRCRELGFSSVNIDLVYGLPYQTVDSFKRTAKAILNLDPDRIALYNFAYLPAKLPFQKRIDENSLPDSEERFAIFQTAIEKFTEYGYCYIGMDHFAKPTDELSIAQNQGTLQRNFMGFTTRAGTDLYAFGTSSISSLPALYTQNTKKLKTYEEQVRSGILPIERGMELSLDDRMRRWVIMELMCNLRVDIDRFEDTWKVDFHQYFHHEIERLKPFIEDGLVDPNLIHELKVTELGHIIIRPIAMTFDAYLNRAGQGKSKPVFSRTL